jgi:hypothetical protein
VCRGTSPTRSLHQCALGIGDVDPTLAEGITMTRLAQAAGVTVGLSFLHSAPASAQAPFGFAPRPIPPLIAQELRRFGVFVPRQRARAALPSHSGARHGPTEVRFSQAKERPPSNPVQPRRTKLAAASDPPLASKKSDVPDPRRMGRHKMPKPALASALPSRPVSASPSKAQVLARSEEPAPVPEQGSAWVEPPAPPNGSVR